jgi:hypothetical protein
MRMIAGVDDLTTSAFPCRAEFKGRMIMSAISAGSYGSRTGRNPEAKTNMRTICSRRRGTGTAVYGV